MRKLEIIVLITVSIVTFVSLIILLLIKITPQPPIEEMKLARELLSNAGRDDAPTYSRKLYTEAKTYYDSAMVNWRRENNRFIYFRDYDKVAKYAVLSSEKAGQATENSKTNFSYLRITVKQKIDSLNKLVTDINRLFTTYPLTSELRNRISQGKFLLTEAEFAFNRGQFLLANRKIYDSEYLLTGSYDNSLSNLKNYFQSYSLWEKWIDMTINESKRNRDYSIIIDKVSRKFYIYQNGIKKYEFEAELGRNWVGDKRSRGDMATPEGRYKITKKFESNKTKYYKALLLNYPNDEDLQNFRREIASGSLPASSRIGELIEIHGNGGKGIDWTEGCIALTDSEMDIIYKIVKVGTPVTIVGSMVDLLKVLNR